MRPAPPFSPLIIASLLFGPWALPAWGIPQCTLNGKSINLSNGNETQGKTGLVVCRDDGTGDTVAEIEYRDGKEVGRQKRRNWQGNWEERTLDEQGRPQGKVTVKKPDGTLVEEENYVDGRRKGVTKAFYDDGKLRRAIYVDDGKTISSVEYGRDGKLYDIRCGPELALAEMKTLCGMGGKESEVTLYSRGKVRETRHYRDGQLLGASEREASGKVTRETKVAADDAKATEEKQFHENGKVKLVVRRRKGRLDGLEQEYHASGKLIRETLWKEGSAIEETLYYLNGKPQAKYRTDQNDGMTLLHELSYFDTGKTSRDCHYIATSEIRTPASGGALRYAGEKTHGLCQTYYPGGALWQKGRYRNGVPEDLHEQFDESGKPLEKLWYHEGHLSRRQRWDAKSGKLVVDEDYFEDGSLKEARIPREKKSAP